MKKTLIIIIIALVPLFLNAQPIPNNPDRPGSGVGDNPNTTAPMPTATILLLGLGVAYSTYKMYKQKQKN